MEFNLTASFVQDNKGYTGWIEEIPGVVAYGDSLELAKEELIKILNIKFKVERDRIKKSKEVTLSNVIKEDLKFALS